MILIKANEINKDEYMDYINAWGKEEIIPYASWADNISFEQWVNNKELIEKKETCPDNLVPAVTYFAKNDEGIIVGAIDIRLELNDYLLNYGGNIGYGIIPSEREKGYAKKMLSKALDICKAKDLDRVLITCDKVNIASSKTIKSQGGILENEVLEDGELVQRYWIGLK